MPENVGESEGVWRSVTEGEDASQGTESEGENSSRIQRSTVENKRTLRGHWEERVRARHEG